MKTFLYISSNPWWKSKSLKFYQHQSVPTSESVPQIKQNLFLLSQNHRIWNRPPKARHIIRWKWKILNINDQILKFSEIEKWNTYNLDMNTAWYITSKFKIVFYLSVPRRYQSARNTLKRFLGSIKLKLRLKNVFLFMPTMYFWARIGNFCLRLCIYKNQSNIQVNDKTIHLMWHIKHITEFIARQCTKFKG